MKDVFSEVGFEPTPENKKEADKKIHQFLGIEYKNCSMTWKEIKIHLTDDREDFIKNLRKILKTV